MRVAFWILLLFLVALALALATRFDAGYVLIVYPPWRMELSLPLAIGAALLAFVLGYVLLRFLRRALMLPENLRSWRGRRRKLRADDQLSRAICALLSEQPDHALKLAGKALKREESPLGFLVAGHAALGAGDRIAARNFMGRVDSQVGELVAARQSLERALGRQPGGAPPVTVPAPGSEEIHEPPRTGA